MDKVYQFGIVDCVELVLYNHFVIVPYIIVRSWTIEGQCSVFFTISRIDMQTDPGLARLAASITRAASLQTYTTVRLLVDRERVAQAFQAYAYFRWVDDWLDEPTRLTSERLAFLDWQRQLIEEYAHGQTVQVRATEEKMLIDLLGSDPDENSGLHSYMSNMMAVMAFDAERRGRLISQEELDHYALSLATAVTEALHYFIGHDSASPVGPTRYLAAQGAHIVHMLRDTLEDNALGYFNIPREYIKSSGISPFETGSLPFRSWVMKRVQLARQYFRQGKEYLADVQSLRCRMAGYAYIARFETVLNIIERDGYVLRSEYRDARGALAGARMGWSVFWGACSARTPLARPGVAPIR